MKAFRNLIYNFGSTTNPWLTIVLIVSLNISWVVTLDVLGRQYKQLAGSLPVDLQNTSAILSAGQAIEQIRSDPPQAKMFYWVFFILDNLMPPLVFGAFALLWAYYLSRHRNWLFDRLSSSSFILIPLGVGGFDWLENLCFITVIGGPMTMNAQQIMELGLIFTRLKAGFLFATFGITFLLTGYHVIMVLYYILKGINTRSTRQIIKP